MLSQLVLYKLQIYNFSPQKGNWVINICKKILRDRKIVAGGHMRPNTRDFNAHVQYHLARNVHAI